MSGQCISLKMILQPKKGLTKAARLPMVYFRVQEVPEVFSELEA